MDPRLHDAYYVEHQIPVWLVFVAVVALIAIGWWLWRTFRVGGRVRPLNESSTWRGFACGAGVFLLVGLLGIVSFSWIEENFFTTSAERVVLEVIRMDATYPGDQTSLTTFRYTVALPDRTETRLVSERLYRVGTRLETNASRSRITGRVLITGPYIVLAE